MKIDKFEDIVAWQKARQLTKQIYTIFEKNRDYSFTDQIKRASCSIMNNVAEGFERKSNKEFILFLFIAKGSSAEVRSLLYLARDLNYLKESEYEYLLSLVMEVAKMLSGFIKSLNIK